MTNITSATPRVASETHVSAQLQARTTSAATEPAPSSERRSQVVVDDRSGLRTTARVLGGIGLAAGAGLGALMLTVGRRTPGAFPSFAGRTPVVIASALAGVGLLGIAAGQLVKPKKIDALAAGIPSPADARERAADLHTDAAVVAAPDGKYAVLSADPDALRSHSRSQPKLPGGVGQLRVDSYVTEHGDALLRTDASRNTPNGTFPVAFENHGVVRGAIDLRTVLPDPATGIGAALAGARLGTDKTGHAIVIDGPLGDPAGYESREVAVRELADSGIDGAALITVDDRVFAVSTRGGNTNSMLARGTTLQPIGAIAFQRGSDIVSLSTPGEGPEAAGAAAPFDLSTITDPASLVERRFAQLGGQTLRLGAIVGDPAGAADAHVAAAAALAADPDHAHAVLRVGDRSVAYALDGVPNDGNPRGMQMSAQFPADRIAVQSGQKLFTPGSDGVLALRERITPFLPTEPIGRRLGGATPSSPVTHEGSFADRAAGRTALTALADQVMAGTHPGAALIGARAADGSTEHLYTLGGPLTGEAWDAEMGSVDGVLRHVDEQWSEQREEGLNELYDYDFSRTRAVLDEPTGSTNLRDTGVQTKSRTYNPGASQSLRQRRELERQREIERQREAERQREIQRQREIEAERQREIDRQRQIEIDRQREIERQRQAERQREIDRQNEIDRQRQREIDQQRQAERDRETQRQRETDAQRQREAEAQRQREREADAQRQREREREADRQREQNNRNSSSNGNADW